MLSKQFRLTKSGSYSYVYNKGKFSGEKNLSLIFVPSKGAPKVGFNVPNKVGKATVRNKVKRRLRFGVAQILPKLKSAQIVVSAKPGAVDMPYKLLNESLLRLFVRADLFKKVLDEKKENSAKDN